MCKLQREQQNMSENEEATTTSKNYVYIYILKLKLEVKGWSEQQRNIGNTAAVFASILAHRPVEMSTGKQATVECDRIPCLVETTQGWTTKEAAREGIGAVLIWCMYMIELHQRFTVWPNQKTFLSIFQH